MKSFIIALLLMLAGAASFGADITVATLTVTNTTGVTNATTITINGSVRTWIWSTNVVTPATEIAVPTNSTVNTCTTNLFAHLSVTPVVNTSLSWILTNRFTLTTSPGVALTVTPSDGWCSVSYATSVLTAAIVVRVPTTVESAAQQTNVNSALVAAISASTVTNAIPESAPAAANLVGLTNAQTVAGAKQFTNAANVFSGIGTNLSLNGWTYVNSNLTVYGTITTTNDVNAGDVTAGAGVFSYLQTTGPIDINGAQTNQGWIAVPAIAAGGGVFTSGLTNLLSTGTNRFPAGADISFGRYALTSLADGNNAAVPVGTNVFVQVSGPTAGFSINGIDGQPNRDGKLLVIVNMTGQNMTVAHDSGVDPTAANRIYTMTGADRATTGNGAAVLIYSASSSRWILFSLDP